MNTLPSFFPMNHRKPWAATLQSSLPRKIFTSEREKFDGRVGGTNGRGERSGTAQLWTYHDVSMLICYACITLIFSVD